MGDGQKLLCIPNNVDDIICVSTPLKKISIVSLFNLTILYIL